MADACQRFTGSTLLILSGNDHTAQEFLEYAATSPALSAALQRPCVSRHDLAGADHTFSSALWRGQVEEQTLTWLNTLPRRA